MAYRGKTAAMVTRDDLREELLAVMAARQELAPGDETYLVEGFLDKVLSEDDPSLERRNRSALYPIAVRRQQSMFRLVSLLSAAVMGVIITAMVQMQTEQRLEHLGDQAFSQSAPSPVLFLALGAAFLLFLVAGYLGTHPTWLRDRLLALAAADH